MSVRPAGMGVWSSAPIQCEHCGRMVAAHDGKPCPFKEAEHKQRLQHAEAEHQARLFRVRHGS